MTGQIRGRAGQVVAGVASAAVLLAVLVGLPVLLTAIAPLAVPHGTTGWRDVLDVLGRRDDGGLLMLALTVLAWGAWLVMATSVLVEVVSVARRRPTPQIPLLKVPQQGAAALVAAVVLTLAPAGTAPGSSHVPAPPDLAKAPNAVSRTTSGTYSATADRIGTPTVRDESAASRTGTKLVAVRTTEPTVRVKRHDTLWALAERHLGSGPRYREIVALNLGRPQADGRSLTDAHWIYPGWVLRLPADAVGVGTTARATAPRPATRPPVVDAAAAAADRGPVDRPGSGAGEGLDLADRAALAAAVTTRAAGPPAAQARTAADESSVVAPVLALGLGALTVGTVLAEVTRQRRRRQGIRAVGERLPQPVQRTERAERLLRAVTDDGRSARIRSGLQHLAESCRTSGRVLPEVTWVRVSATTLELVLAADDPDVVPPFALTSPRIWSWSGDVDHGPECEDLPDPYPALVTVGLDGDELVLVNLEAAGTLRVAGEPSRSTPVMAAMTADLMGRNRSGSVTVSVAGSDVPIPPVAARTAASTESAAAQLDAHQGAVRDVLAQCGVADIRQARSAGVADETWVPEIVLGTDVAASAAPWSGAAVVRGGDAATAGEWTLHPGEGAQWQLDPPGIAVVPQRLEPEDQQTVAMLVGAAPPVRVPATDSSSPTLSAQVARVRAALERVPARGPGEPGAPRVLLLGPVELTGVDDAVAPGRSRRATELVAYLVLHPGAGRYELDEVLWPGRRVGRNTRNPFVSRTRQWLGRTPAGDAYLPLVAESGEYRLREEISCDWNDFVAMALRGTQGEEVDVAELQDALALVRGRPFQGIDPATYCWADPDVQEMVSAVVDVAHLLAAAAYVDGDLRTSAAAATRGLAVEPVSELLHRDALLAAKGLGADAVDRAVSRLSASLDEEDELMPETLTLLDDLGIRLDR